MGNFCCRKRIKSKNVKDIKRKVSLPKQKKHKKDPSTYAKSPQEWQKRKSVTPSMIPDEHITDEYLVPSQMYETFDDVIHERGFQIGDKIGKGSYGEVRKGMRLADQKVVACKIIVLKNKRQRINDIRNELYFLVKMRHENIVQLYDHFMINNVVHIFMEYASEGSLSKYVHSHGPLEESEAKQFFAQIISAISYMHSNSVAHQDLKLGNILITVNDDSKKILKVADFGLTRRAFKPEKGIIKQKLPVGTVLFMSPQIIKLKLGNDTDSEDKHHGYNPLAADIWALGVILYTMVSKAYPFSAKDKQKMLINQIYKRFKFPNKVSCDCQNLIRCMLEPDINLRITITGIMSHNWLQCDKSIVKLSHTDTESQFG